MMKTITVSTEAGALTFRRPDDATAMRILRLSFRIARQAQNASLHEALWRELASLCSSPPDRALVEATRQLLPADDPTQRWSVTAHWLAIRLGAREQTFVQAIETLTGLPDGTLTGKHMEEAGYGC
jgi:hypothetical protein